MGLFLGRETSEARVAPLFPPPPIPPFLGADINGNVTDVAARPDLALTNSTVWACVSLLAGTISSLPLESFTPNPDGGVPLRTNDPPFLRVPDDRMTPIRVAAHADGVTVDAGERVRPDHRP